MSRAIAFAPLDASGSLDAKRGERPEWAAPINLAFVTAIIGVVDLARWHPRSRRTDLACPDGTHRKILSNATSEFLHGRHVREKGLIGRQNWFLPLDDTL